MEECGGLLFNCCCYYMFCCALCCTFLEEQPKPVVQAKQTVTPLTAITPEIGKQEIAIRLGYSKG